jgi:hypothetical protein
MLADKGDVLFDGAGGQLYRRQLKRRYTSIVHGWKGLDDFLFQQSIHTGFASRFLTSRFVENALPEIREAIRRYISRFRDLGKNEDLLDLFHLHNSAGLKFSVDLLVQSYFQKVRQPFYDRELFELCRQVPVPLRRQHIFHRTLVESWCPRLTEVPLETRGYRIPYRGFRIFRSIVLGLEKIPGKTAFSLQRRLERKSILDTDRLDCETLREQTRLLLDEGTLTGHTMWNRPFLEEIREGHTDISRDEHLQLLNILLMVKRLGFL